MDEIDAAILKVIYHQKKFWYCCLNPNYHNVPSSSMLVYMTEMKIQNAQSNLTEQKQIHFMGHFSRLE